MRSFLRPVALVAVVVGLSPALRADDRAAGPLPRGELDRRIAGSLSEAVRVGVDIFNRGNHEGCYRLYQGSLRAVVPMLDHRPDLKGRAEMKLRQAAGLPRPSDQAFLLREAIDEIQETLVRDLRASRPAAGKSLYERLGGEAAIKAVVDDFVARAAANPRVNFTRKGTGMEWEPTPENVERLKRSLEDLIGQVTGGPQKYRGRSMKAAHRGMMITDAEFDALAADLKATLDKFNVPKQEQDELFQIVGSTRGDIVEKR
jgi:hemoglobin